MLPAWRKRTRPPRSRLMSSVIRRRASLRIQSRVAAGGSGEELVDQTQVDPATWRKLRLRVDAALPHGTPDVFDIETLQTPHWLLENGVEVGAAVPVPLDLVELGLSQDLTAKVLSDESCPTIESGAGRVVLTTVSHLNNEVYELTVRSMDGRNETVRPTAQHKFYRASDQAFIQKSELAVGDELEGVDGPIYVTGLRQVPGTHRVYNLTVEDDHVYRVSLLGALVHNNGCKVMHHSTPPKSAGSYLRASQTIRTFVVAKDYPIACRLTKRFTALKSMIERALATMRLEFVAGGTI
jgi:hypothetical protein